MPMRQYMQSYYNVKIVACKKPHQTSWCAEYPPLMHSIFFSPSMNAHLVSIYTD